MLKPPEVEENAAASTQGPLAPADLERIVHIYRNNDFIVRNRA
jgi:hypothetical protein